MEDLLKALEALNKELARVESGEIPISPVEFMGDTGKALGNLKNVSLHATSVVRGVVRSRQAASEPSPEFPG